jgi:hypothetical protein
MASLAQTLHELTAEGELYTKLENGRVRCHACGHRCLIPEGASGVCRVRFGYVAGAPARLLDIQTLTRWRGNGTGSPVRAA